MAWDADLVVITWGDLSVHRGCVVRVESTRQDSMTSLWMSLARGMRPGHSLQEVPMVGTCERSMS